VAIDPGCPKACWVYAWGGLDSSFSGQDSLGSKARGAAAAIVPHTRRVSMMEEPHKLEREEVLVCANVPAGP